MNVATEMTRMLIRFDELINYAQEKIDRTEERKDGTLALAADQRRKAALKVVSDAQRKESDANLADQKESFDERNKDPGMIDGPETVPDPADEPTKRVVKDPPKTTKKKKSAG